MISVRSLIVSRDLLIDKTVEYNLGGRSVASWTSLSLKCLPTDGCRSGGRALSRVIRSSPGIRNAKGGAGWCGGVDELSFGYFCETFRLKCP